MVLKPFIFKMFSKTSVFAGSTLSGSRRIVGSPSPPAPCVWPGQRNHRLCFGWGRCMLTPLCLWTKQAFIRVSSWIVAPLSVRGEAHAISPQSIVHFCQSLLHLSPHFLLLLSGLTEPCRTRPLSCLGLFWRLMWALLLLLLHGSTAVGLK